MIKWKAGITTWREEINLDEKAKKIFAENASHQCTRQQEIQQFSSKI